MSGSPENMSVGEVAPWQGWSCDATMQCMQVDSSRVSYFKMGVEAS